MKLIEKISAAKKEIKESKLKKEGTNKFSNYDYFTPSQIEFLVQQVCQSQKMLTKFDLIRDSLGVFGVLTIFDTETEDKLEYTMASAIPEIKATNISQQLGGCMTYTERYLKTSAFGITDNNLDFDNSKPEPQKKIVESESDINIYSEWLSVVSQAKTLDELMVIYNGKKSTIDAEPTIKAMFTKKRVELEKK
tara:strand:- start:155 stop:733 length:579 start_codon:yes stop_codon:yes gene_type:complete